MTLSAAQDADAVDETGTVTHSVSSSDSSYQGATASSVTVNVTDDDAAGVTVSETALSIGEAVRGRVLTRRRRQ